ncbi:MAG: hypothetical protein LH473_10020 [Chitinophagales bacterium]|nr:hypothetical protein [Chitinophagales bacterium]
MKIFSLIILSVMLLKGKGCTDSEGNPIPQCIQNMVTEYQNKQPASPPPSIYEYDYKGMKVFFVRPPCCDQFSKLYDSNCNLLGSPDGGITGKGDGKLPDFFTERTNEVLIWKDPRMPEN